MFLSAIMGEGFDLKTVYYVWRGRLLEIAHATCFLSDKRLVNIYAPRFLFSRSVI